MAWGKAHTRRATVSDIDALVEIIRLARGESPIAEQLCTPDSEHLSELLRTWLGLEHSSLLIAEFDEKIVGFTLLQVVTPSLFNDISFLQIEALFVQYEFRRRGIGRTLMGEAARTAEDLQLERVVTIVLTGSRNEQRFLSGLGFAPAGARRIAETPTLHRRLSSSGRERRGRSLDELIARRRRNRDTTVVS